MIHYSCDRCKRVMDSDDPLRYILRIEIQAAIDSENPQDEDDERDHLKEIETLLENSDDPDCEELRNHMHQQRRYDLCHDCYEQYVRNPLSVEPQVSFGFSEN